MFKKWYMKSEMKKIVRDCMSRYEGGESYFNELDSLVKSNTKLMIEYIKNIVKKEKCYDVILSGEIGEAYGKIYDQMEQLQVNTHGIRIHLIPGGLRNGTDISRLLDHTLNGKQAIFLDDSFYSGKTFRAVYKFAINNMCRIKAAYVFYDGSKEKDTLINVHSLYRYYDYHK